MIELPETGLNSWRAYRFLKYSLAGAVGTGLHFLALFSLVNWLATSPVIASLAGALMGAICNFALNHHLVFASKHSYSRTAPRFFAIAALSIAINTVLMDRLINHVQLHYLVAQVLTTAFVLAVSYCLNTLWTFGVSNDSK